MQLLENEVRIKLTYYENSGAYWIDRGKRVISDNIYKVYGKDQLYELYANIINKIVKDYFRNGYVMKYYKMSLLPEERYYTFQTSVCDPSNWNFDSPYYPRVEIEISSLNMQYIYDLSSYNDTR